MAGGTGGVQLVGVAAAPLLTRLYTPEDFGVLAVYTACLAVSLSFATGRYEIAIPLPEHDKEAVNLLAVAVSIAFCSLGWSLLATWLLGELFVQRLNIKSLGGFLWLIPLGVFFSSLYSIFSYWGIRKSAFRSISTTKLTQGIGLVFTQLVCFQLGALGLVLGQLAGQTLGTLKLVRLVSSAEISEGLSIRNCLQVAHKYVRFPLFSMPGALMNTLAVSSVPLVISASFDSTQTGHFSLAYRILILPIGLVGGALSQVFLSHAVEAYRDGNLAEMVDRLQKRLLLIGVLPLATMVLFGPTLFSFAFGTEWRKAGEYGQIIAPWLTSQFVSSPLSMVFTVISQERKYMLWQMFQLCLFTLALSVGTYHDNLQLLLIATCAAGVLSYGAMFLWTRNALRLPILPIYGRAVTAP